MTSIIEARNKSREGIINSLTLGNKSISISFPERIFFIKPYPEKPILENKKRAIGSMGTCLE
jgi:hypothetical protein